MHNKIIKILSINLLVLSLFSCTKVEHDISFYYWKNQYQVDDALRGKVKALGCKKVYLRFFDVVWENGRTQPIAVLSPVKENPLMEDSVKIVPVVFITNEVFAATHKMEDLAESVAKQIQGMAAYNKVLGKCDEEIQVDCDWTRGTKEKYFAFLRALKKISGAKISCTIRLHQIKDADEMGIPPAEKGYLMCYATSDPTDGQNSNSILDIDLLKNYTKSLNKYPLPLDYALPLFSWGIVTNHLGKVRLINGVSRDDLESAQFTHLEGNKYKALEACFLNGFYVSKGFTIELEEISPSLLREAKQYLDKKIGHSYTIVYYHLSNGYLNRYTSEDLR